MARGKKRTQGRIGSSFDSFLAEQGILQECEELSTVYSTRQIPA
jgi:hypothetical protein